MFEKGTTACATLGSFAFFLAAPGAVAGLGQRQMWKWTLSITGWR